MLYGLKVRDFKVVFSPNLVEDFTNFAELCQRPGKGAPDLRLPMRIMAVLINIGTNANPAGLTCWPAKRRRATAPPDHANAPMSS